MDRDLRALERRSPAGDAGAAGQLLLRRLRAGRLRREALELAAALNHPPALAALGRAPATEPAELRAWVQGLVDLEPAGRPLAVRALVTAARAIEDLTAADERHLEAAEAWCECPCPAHAEAAYRASRGDGGEDGPRGARPLVAYHAVMAAHLAGHQRGPNGRTSLRSMVGIALRSVVAAGADPAGLRERIRADLVRRALAGEA